MGRRGNRNRVCCRRADRMPWPGSCADQRTCGGRESQYFGCRDETLAPCVDAVAPRWRSFETRAVARIGRIVGERREPDEDVLTFADWKAREGVGAAFGDVVAEHTR